MATSVFKTFLDSDKTTTRTLLHEYIPITGTLMSGTYGPDTVHLGSEGHVKTFSHGMFSSVYDYPHLSSSANHVMDISIGVHDKARMLGHVAKILVTGTPTTNSTMTLVDSYGWTYILKFTADANDNAGRLDSCEGKTRTINVSTVGGTGDIVARIRDVLSKGYEDGSSYEGCPAVGGALGHGHFIARRDQTSDMNIHIKQPTAGTAGATTITLDEAAGSTNITIVNQFAAPASTAMADKKLNMYSQMAQILMGYDTDNNVALFDADGIVGTDDTSKLSSCVFVSLSRLITKDEIKKGSFLIDIDVRYEAGGPLLANVANAANQVAAEAKILRITDTGAATGFKSGSPAGEVGVLVANTQRSYDGGAEVLAGALLEPDTLVPTKKVGLIYYQAGIIVLTSSLFQTKEAATTAYDQYVHHVGDLNVGADKYVVGFKNHSAPDSNANADTFMGILSGSTMNAAADFVRSRIIDMTFNNTTELNSSVYFCRANHNEFNYSSNRTYLNGSKIRVKAQAQDMPRSYITTVGLYSANNELMAVAKLSEPIRKDPTNEATVRVRLDY
jgi:hypothetical protein